MQAFITGACGFLGTNLIHHLIEQKISVTVIHRKSSNISAFEGMPVKWFEGDVLDRDSLMKACPEAVDMIFHIAADTSMWSAKNAQQNRINVVGTANMLQVAKAKKARRFIHTSSIAAYGSHAGEVITEKTPQLGGQCFSNYYRTKFLSEQLVKNAVANEQLDAVILNPCHLVGAWDRHNWSELFMLVSNNRLPGIPPGYGSFCHIKEVAKARLKAAKVGRRGENYILSGTYASFVEFITEIGRLVGKNVPEKAVPALVLKFIAQISNGFSKITRKEPDLTPEKALIVCDDLQVSSKKAQQELGYNANVELTLMLEESYQWMKHEGLLN